MKILFLGVGRRVELVQVFREAAFVSDKNIIIYGEDIDDTAPALAYVDRRFWLCRIKDERYIDELLKGAEKEQIDLIIPTIDTNLLILAENKDLFEAKGIRVLICLPETIRICRDKIKTYEFFKRCSLEAPKTISRLEDFDDLYPCFIKPKDGSSSINAYKVGNRKDLETFAEKIGNYIIQPFIDGVEYTVDIFCDFFGKPIYITPRKRLAVRAGEVLKTQICIDRQIIEECRKIIEKFRPCGPITVQLIKDQKGVDHYIEINPRFGGGCPISMKAGAQSAEALIDLLDGEIVREKTVIEDNAIYSRFDQSVCIRRRRSQLIRGVIFDLDDTLYSEKEYVRSGYKAVAQHLGDRGLSKKMWNFFLRGKLPIDEVLNQLGRESEIAECVNIYREHKPKIHLYDGVMELFESLKERNIKVGIITDGRPKGQRNKVKALGLEMMMDDIIITDELGGTQFRKPCDIAFRIMAQRWKLPYESIIYIGDNTGKDFQASRQLGMQSIWFDNEDGLYRKCGKREDFYERIENLKEVYSLVSGEK